MLCAGYQGEASVHTRALRSFAEACRRLSTGEIAPSVQANVTQDGLKAADLLDRVERGSVDLCYFASSYLAERVPSLRALDVPFGISDRASAYAGLDGRLGQLLRADVESRTGFRLLAFWDNGIRHVSNGLRPIRCPTDCVGMRLRCLDSPVHHRVFSAMSFQPITVDVKDLVAAVISGEVDAQENPHTNTLNFGLFRSHRYISETGHFFGAALLLANKERLALRPANVREVISQAAADATAIQRRMAVEEDITSRRRLLDEGCEILPASELDLPAFLDAVRTVRDGELAGLDYRVRTELPG